MSKKKDSRLKALLRKQGAEGLSEEEMAELAKLQGSQVDAEDEEGDEDKGDKPTMVTVPKDKLDLLLETARSNAEEIAELRHTLGENKIKAANPKEAGNPKCFLKIMQDNEGADHLIVGWKSSPDSRMVYSTTNPNVPVGEVIQSEYTGHDGWRSGMVDQINFTRILKVAWFEILEKRGNTLVLQPVEVDGNDNAFKFTKEAIEVDVTFVNP